MPLGRCGLSCSPAGDNHVQFYAACPPPAWHVVIAEAGHLDLLDENRAECGLVCRVCPAGRDPASVRKLTAGLLTAFFRGVLSGDTGAFEESIPAEAAGGAVTVESR